MPNILFVSSKNTGYGHQSIFESLREQLELITPDLNVEVSDAFILCGSISEFMSKLYNYVVVHFPTLWSICYKFANLFPQIIRFFSSLSFSNRFCEVVKKCNPHMIVVLHPGFVSAVHEVLKKMNRNTPVIVFIADFDNVTSLWADKRTKYTICPTQNAKETMLKLGLPSDKLKVFTFPARDRFNHFEPLSKDRMAEQILKKASLTFLLLNGSQGTGYFIKTAKSLLKSFNCQVIIIAGRNKALKNKLESELLPIYKNKVSILGFVNDIENYMSFSDIIITRASPNVLTEAINLCKPIIVTGAFTGQEAKNPQFIKDHSLGIVCENIDSLSSCVNELLEDGGKKLREIYQSQLNFRNTSSSREISEFIIENIDAVV